MTTYAVTAIKPLFGVIANIFILISLFNVTGGFLNSYLRYTYLLYMTVRIEFNCFNSTAFELGCRFLLNGKLFFLGIFRFKFTYVLPTTAICVGQMTFLNSGFTYQTKFQPFPDINVIIQQSYSPKASKRIAALFKAYL